ncbi:MAG: SDR family oxidoreductase [Ignavibacteria bacterium]|nr:SDR family oxidoreductase [Ignavibacteria bacterium]
MSNIQNKFSLSEKIAVVTGALGLLGRQHCRALSEAGAIVIVCDLDRIKCNEFAKELPGIAHGFQLDVTVKNCIINLKTFIQHRYGRLDILINNAAINDMFENRNAAFESSKFENYPLEMWDKSIKVNLTGMFLCSQILGKLMFERKQGSIINIASTYGVVAPDQKLYTRPDGTQPFFKSPVYSVTKGAVIAFTKYLAAYWGSSGVRVNTLSPGGVENGQEEYFIKKYSDKTPLGRMAKADDYMGAVVYLASEASAYVTGANLIVDGGWTIC